MSANNPRLWLVELHHFVTEIDMHGVISDQRFKFLLCDTASKGYLWKRLSSLRFPRSASDCRNKRLEIFWRELDHSTFFGAHVSSH